MGLGQRNGAGQDCETYREKVTLTLKGAEVTRNATPDNPAYQIIQDDR